MKTDNEQEHENATAPSQELSEGEIKALLDEVTPTMAENLKQSIEKEQEERERRHESPSEH